MTVSVVIPAYNAARFLPQTVPSVLSLTNVSEWIWVDDGSTDGTYDDLVRLTRDRENVTILRHDSNRGRAAARNTGLGASMGAVIACLDVDARPRPGYIGCHLDALAHDGAVASIGRIVPADPIVGDPYSVYLGNHPRGPHVDAGPTSWAHLVTCAACIRSETLARAGGFNTAIAYGEDAELACRLATTAPNGLHVAHGATVDLYGTQPLSGALAKTREFGEALPLILAACPDALQVLGLSSLEHRGAVLALRSAPLARLVLRLLPRLPESLVATGVRYLLGHALYSGYTDALEGLSSDS